MNRRQKVIIFCNLGETARQLLDHNMHVRKYMYVIKFHIQQCLPKLF
jgi:hypothetical protein